MIPVHLSQADQGQQARWLRHGGWQHDTRLPTTVGHRMSWRPSSRPLHLRRTAAVIVRIPDALPSRARPLTSVEQNQLSRDLAGHQGDKALIDLGERHRRAHEFVQFELPREVPVDVLRHIEPEAIRTHV